MSASEVSVERLSLRIAGLNAPFTLCGSERDFGPDDWAWQFLRLSTGYQREYAKALASHKSATDDPLEVFNRRQTHPERKLCVSELVCRRQYGLSTWLDPQTTRLPELNAGESWFYPLTRSTDSPEEPSLQLPLEGVFAYSDTTQLRKLRPANVQDVWAHLQQWVWFAVDCSVPPTAQMKSVEAISRMGRVQLRQLNAKRQPSMNSAREICPLRSCSWFDADTFETASAVADTVEPSSVWYAIRVDVLGPIKEQVSDYSGRLNSVYKGLCKNGAALQPVRERFRYELKGECGEDGTQVTDGNFLKALVLCAQLAQSGLDEKASATFIELHAPTGFKGTRESQSVRNDWSAGLPTRVGNYREHARSFVKGGYRWLVHAQKP